MSASSSGPTIIAAGPKPLEPTNISLANVPCETCGNTYDKAFKVVMEGQAHVFDCFECAIQALAPVCEHCGCRIIGHGLEEDGHFFCCGHCAHREGANQVTDRA